MEAVEDKIFAAFCKALSLKNIREVRDILLPSLVGLYAEIHVLMRIAFSFSRHTRVLSLLAFLPPHWVIHLASLFVNPFYTHQYEERELKAMREWEEKLASLRDHRDKLRAQLDYEEGRLRVLRFRRLPLSSLVSFCGVQDAMPESEWLQSASLYSLS